MKFPEHLPFHLCAHLESPPCQCWETKHFSQTKAKMWHLIGKHIPLGMLEGRSQHWTGIRCCRNLSGFHLNNLLLPYISSLFLYSLKQRSSGRSPPQEEKELEKHKLDFSVFLMHLLRCIISRYVRLIFTARLQTTLRQEHFSFWCHFTLHQLNEGSKESKRNKCESDYGLWLIQLNNYTACPQARKEGFWLSFVGIAMSFTEWLIHIKYLKSL